MGGLLCVYELRALFRYRTGTDSTTNKNSVRQGKELAIGAGTDSESLPGVDCPAALNVCMQHQH